jgi:hypothetical protein
MSEKIKELLDTVKVTDWSQIGDRIDEIKLMLDNIKKPKRKPLSDGTLPLTKEEIQELSKIIGKRVELVGIVNDTIFISYFVESAGEYGGEETPSIRAIAYLLERFELTTNN